MRIIFSEWGKKMAILELKTLETCEFTSIFVVYQSYLLMIYVMYTTPHRSIRSNNKIRNLYAMQTHISIKSRQQQFDYRGAWVASLTEMSMCELAHSSRYANALWSIIFSKRYYLTPESRYDYEYDCQMCLHKRRVGFLIGRRIVTRFRLLYTCLRWLLRYIYIYI